MWLLIILVLSLWPISAEAQSPPTSQCVTSAVAGGTGDAITIPNLPCVPTTTLLLLTITSPNSTTTPTLSPPGGPALPIVGHDGASLGVGQLAAGGHYILSSNGQKWYLLTTSTTVTGLSNPVLGTLNVNGFDLSVQNQPTGVPSNTIYGNGGPMCPGCQVADVIQAVGLSPPGTPSTVTAVNGVASYVKGETSTTNVVSFFGAELCTVDHETCWGGNTIEMDSAGPFTPGQAPGTGVGRGLVGWEYDFIVSQSGTSITAVSLLGCPGCNIHPTFAQGFTVGAFDTLGGVGSPRWNYSFVSTSGTANVALFVGSGETSGTNIASQTIQFGYFNSGGTGNVYQIGVDVNQQFDIVNNQGAGLAKFGVDGSITAGAASSGYILGGDQVIAASTAHQPSFGGGGSITQVGIGNGTAPVKLLSPTVGLQLVPATGTGAASVCLDSSGNIFKKTTPGACL